MSMTVDEINELESRVRCVEEDIIILKNQKKDIFKEYERRQKETDDKIRILRNEQNSLYNKIDAEKERIFKEDLFKSHGYELGDPIAEKVFSKAYERGHSGGFSEVRCEFEDLIDLFRN